MTVNELAELDALAPAVDWLDAHRQHWEDRLDRMGDHLRRIQRTRKQEQGGVLGDHLRAGHRAAHDEGTAASTGLLADIAVGGDFLQPPGFTKLGSKLYFRATTVAAGSELWSTDAKPCAIPV